MVVASFTGVPLKSKDEAEYIGNAQDAYLRHYCQSLKKAKQAKSTAASKARKAGRTLPSSSHHDERIAELEERVYKCSFGGVARILCIGDPIHKQ